MKNKEISSNLLAQQFVLSEIISHMPGYVFWKNLDHIYMGCNRNLAEIAGFKSPADFIGKTDQQLPWFIQAQSYQQDDNEVMTTGQPKFNIEDRVIHADGTLSIVLTNKVPLLDKEGNIIGVLAISSDITELKKREEDLRQAKETSEAANRAKSEFITHMSHDIRTPLSGIIGMSKLLKETARTTEEKEYAQCISESGKQLLELLNGVLDVVSVGAITERDIYEETFSLRKSIEAIAALELPTVKIKGLALKIDIDPDLPEYICSDKTKIERIILNLLGNAIKFTDAGYVGITVKVIAQNEKISLAFSVHDSGQGIPLELQDKVFEKFFSVKPSSGGVYRGHGVGLSIVQKYVELLGGEIKVSSEVGKGSTFYFNLSLKASKIESAYPAIDSTSKINAANNATLNRVKEPLAENLSLPQVLLVEDNRTALKLAEIAIKQAGCQFSSVRDSQTALDLAKTTPFDLILTDISLPELSGIEITKLIRADEQHTHKKSVPIIGLTASLAEEVEQECLEAGMNKILCKPVTIEAIQALVQQFIWDKIAIPAVHNTRGTPQEKTPSNSFGFDLPSSEEEFFNLSQYPLLDVASALKIYGAGGEAILREVLATLMSKSIPEDLLALQEAFNAKNWLRIEELAHRIKGGASYCGTIRMRQACQYLERYHKANYSALLERLYDQVVSVLNDTKLYLEKWHTENKI